MDVKKVSENIIQYIGIYGALFGAIPPLIYSILTVIAPLGTPTFVPAESFRYIYYFRMFVALAMGTLVGGFTSAFAAKIALKYLKKISLARGIIVGAIGGMIVGFLTAGSSPLAMLIASSDYGWALETIKRTSIMGAIVGVFAGGVIGALVGKYLDKADLKKYK